MFLSILTIRENNLKLFIYKLVFLCYYKCLCTATSGTLQCKHQIKNDFSYRLLVVLSCKERWTDWHQTHAHMMISSQSQYLTATRTEISTPNRSVISSPHSLRALCNYWADHYLAMCTSELWISIIKPAHIKMPIFILQTVPFKLHQQCGPKHKTCL